VEIDFFRQNLTELAETVTELMGGKQNILFVCHPHLQHLVPGPQGKVWNRFAAETVAEVTSQLGISFYDAKDDLERAFRGRPQDYYWHGDMHLNFAGFRIYGTLIAERLRSMIAAKVDFRGNEVEALPAAGNDDSP
jgi:hypothetical protein